MRTPASPAVEEDNFFGKTSSSEPSADRATHPFVKTDKAVIMGWEQTASGYAAVWATENTREAIFDAMKRRETYATTGPRMIVRFFGGWDFEPGDANNRLPARVGYTKGVPMGGDLSAAPQGKSPSFLVAALKDPIGANLDRIQIIKGWLGKDGQTQERIYDVAVSGGRTDRCRWPQQDVRGQYGGRRERDLDQHDRCGRDDHGLERPGLRSGVARVLLRARDRNPDAALDGVRCEIFRRQDAQRSPDDDDRARLHVADLVHALKLPLLREPLLHFLVLGAALFGLFSMVGKKDAEAPAKIVVSASRVATLADGFARTWRRPPTEQELQGLVEDYIRDEIFYREGRAAGLDRDDVVIRRRVRQKMEFLAEDMAAAEPSDEQLAAYLASNPERFRTEDRLTFHQVFLSATRRGSALDGDARQIAETLARTSAPVDTATIGDPFLLGEEFREMSQSDVARTFGEGFAKQLSAVEPGRWQGPIPSSFGVHFVFVDERAKGSLPPLDAVREAVQREWLNARRIEAEQKLYRTLRDRYQIVVETPPKAAASETAR